MAATQSARTRRAAQNTANAKAGDGVAVRVYPGELADDPSHEVRRPVRTTHGDMDRGRRRVRAPCEREPMPPMRRRLLREIGTALLVRAIQQEVRSLRLE